MAAKGSVFTVLLALLANAAVGVMKLVAGLLSGSAALLSEAAHSVGDTSTELLLLTALRRSTRPADPVHPFGYGKERFFWSLLAAVAIFASGAVFSVYEAVSLRQAVRQTRGEARQRRRSVRSVVREPHDPTVRSVLLEDSAAVAGIIVAAVGVGLHELTGSAMWDGAASLAIGAVLVVAAVLLAQACKALLVGRQADPRLMRSIETVLEQQDEVDDVVDLLTMLTGADRVLVCTRVDFADGFTTSELEQACVRIDRTLRERFSDLDEIFIQPAPKWDPQVRARVRARYGHELAGR